MKESDLYQPVKAYLEQLGYQVKSEVKDCDIVAIKKDADNLPETLIVELKLSFSLELIHQGINRKKLSDTIYLAVPEPDTAIKRKNWRSKLKANLKLCRLLGLGLMTVDMKEVSLDQVKVLLYPAPYAPRQNIKRQQSLQAEFSRRVGDPNSGGVNKQKIMTAYRQRALLCASHISTQKCMTLKELKLVTEISDCAAILQKNHYQWFERIARGKYCLTNFGIKAVDENKNYLAKLKSSNNGKALIIKA